MTNRFLRSVRGLVTASSKGNQSRITINHTHTPTLAWIRTRIWAFPYHDHKM